MLRTCEYMNDIDGDSTHAVFFPIFPFMGDWTSLLVFGNAYTEQCFQFLMQGILVDYAQLVRPVIWIDRKFNDIERVCEKTTNKIIIGK